MKNISRYVQGFDELNTLVGGALGSEETSVEDVIETMLILAYKRGVEDTEDDLDYFFDTEAFVGDMQKSINKKIDGKTWKDRADEYLADGNAEGIMKVAETEYHRVHEEASMKAAETYQKITGNPVMKRWVTVKDNRVRATHEPLEGLEKPLNEKFNTIDGDSALYPGGFENATNNINCRCSLEFK